MCVSEVSNSKSFLRSFFIILMFGLLSNINLTANPIVSLRGTLINKLHISKDIKKLLVELTFFYIFGKRKWIFSAVIFWDTKIQQISQ